jgi:protein TonB
MKAAFILKADLLDIIFENRNKDYGAYPLRKYYHERLYKALGITFLFISLLSLYVFIDKPTIELTNPFVITDITKSHLKPVEKKITPVVQKPKQVIPLKPLNSQIFTSVIKIVDSTMESTKPAKNLDSAAISNVNNIGTSNGNAIVKSEIRGETIPVVNNEILKLIDKTKPLLSAEIMPSYPGGLDALMKFLKKNIQDPHEGQYTETISVKIKFIVGYDGVLKGFETVEDGGKDFNNEVIRVLKKMPAWIPGKTAGESVSVYYTIPVKFVSQD